MGALCLALAVALAQPASDAQAEGRAAYEEASRLFEEEAFLDAARALERAYALDPKLDYLYQRGHALRLAGSCDAALDVFAEVQAGVQSDEQRAEVAKWIEHCQRVVDETRGGEPPPPQPPAEPLPEAPLPGDTPQLRPPRHDVAAGITLGLGSAAAVAGAALLISSGVLARGRREDERMFEDRVVRVRNLEIAGAVVLSVGLAAVVGAVVRYAVLRRRYRAGR